MPKLTGHFPLTISTVLRALAMHYIITCQDGAGAGAGAPASSKQLGRAPAKRRAPGQRQPQQQGGAGAGAGAGRGLATDTLATLFQRPYYAQQDPGLLQQVQHLFTFSVEYLLRSGAIGLQGEPVGEHACLLLLS